MTVVTRHRRTKATVALGPAWPRRWPASWPGSARELAAEALAVRQARTVAACPTPERRPRPGPPGSPGALVGPGPEAARPSWPPRGSRVRCLQRPDGGLADDDDDEGSLVAVVGRAY